jgi:hypothetical protein
LNFGVVLVVVAVRLDGHIILMVRGVISFLTTIQVMVVMVQVANQEVQEGKVVTKNPQSPLSRARYTL